MALAAGRSGRDDLSLPEDVRKRLSELFYGMMSALYRTKGAQLSVGILSAPQVMEFIGSHAAALDSSFEQVPMSDTMRRGLRRSDFIFSGIKTFHELNEAFPSLLDEKGNLKSFERFLNDVRKVDETYNAHYLRAEYNFVKSSARMAAKWEEFMQDGDRYNLQYRTQKDDRVRPEHAALDGVTLPPSDPFWQKFFPPNGWNCRCDVVQVRKSKYPVTDHEEAMRLGEEALQKDSKGIFRFNPGLERKSVPDYNPYTVRRCRDCDINKRQFAFRPLNSLCEACAIINECYNDLSKSESAVVKKHYMREMEPLLTKKISVNGNGHPMNVGFSKYGNKHLYSDTFGRSSVLTKDDLASLDSLLAGAKFIKKVAKSKPRRDRIERFYYYEAELHGRKVYLNVGETDIISRTGKIRHDRFLYSITDTIQ